MACHIASRARAALGENRLLTRDKIIRANYPHAVW
jgi:hypothetical protein